ncbi:unnamed protein product [Cylindrotheca closterium]|uniref:snRNA-activating protein complex subunit 3 n=1 Tax=Cylindrotheca closterium TaxID=2856 RepID=A0AAD2FE56_9STRA|nr:unnamed protein product [Cylindrotheca closterium]
MKRRHTCQESEEKWKQLLTLSQFGTKHHLPMSMPMSMPMGNNKNDDDDDDPQADNNHNNSNNGFFDCQGMEAPTTKTLVDGVLEEFTAKWRALDARRILIDNDQNDNNNTDSKEMPPPPPKRKYRRGGWEHTQEQLLTLPPNFDYTTSNDRPPSPSPNDKHDKVIDLLNPTQHYSYHQELWKLFQQIPTLEDLLDESRANAQIPNSLAVHSEMQKGNQLVHRMDAHALCRLRMSHRHGLPPPPITTTTTTTTCLDDDNNNNNNKMVGTIRFEFWRRQPKRGPGPDPRRMVLEFLSSQTLLDVHHAIVGMTEDDDWTASQKDDTNDAGCFFIEETFYTTNGREKDDDERRANNDENTQNAAMTTANSTVGGAAAANTTNRPDENGTPAATSVAALAENDDNNGDNTGDGTAYNNASATASSNDAGMDYVTTIAQWLDGGGIPNPTRRQYLGIATSNRFRSSTPMKDAILKDIPFRLGVRYYHVMHGDVECSVMVTDKRLVSEPSAGANTNIPNNKTPQQYPIIHDIWVPNYPVPICEACDRFAAVYVYFHRGTPAQKYQDGDPKGLCDNCCKALKLLEKEEARGALQLYHVWKNKFELSTAMVRSEQCRFF